MTTLAICAALERLLQVVKPEYNETEEIIAVVQAIAAARDVLAAADPAEGESIDRSQISDGYHTFAELYQHRYSLMLALMRALPHLCWFSQRHHDGELPFGSADWFIVGANLPTGGIAYHLPIELLSLARQTGAAELSAGHPWDGHTASDVIVRLRAWVAAAIEPDPADGGEALLAMATAAPLVREDKSGCARLELVTAIYCLASHFEIACSDLSGDDLQKARNDIAYARRIAAKHNQNGPGCPQFPPAYWGRPAALAALTDREERMMEWLKANRNEFVRPSRLGAGRPVGHQF